MLIKQIKNIKMEKKISPRQELASFSACGNLSHEAIDLLVNIALRYCTSTNRKKRNKLQSNA